MNGDSQYSFGRFSQFHSGWWLKTAKKCLQSKRLRCHALHSHEGRSPSLLPNCTWYHVSLNDSLFTLKRSGKSVVLMPVLSILEASLIFCLQCSTRNLGLFTRNTGKSLLYPLCMVWLVTFRSMYLSEIGRR